jgi:hypothetical protein
LSEKGVSVKVECYGDEFEQYLTDLLSGAESIGRRRLFEAFVRGATFFCGRCKQEFEMRSTDGVEEDHEVLCLRCRKKS